MSNILKCFSSRWGDYGVIIEADFSQLEVVALAILSEDPYLQGDIHSGKDMHCMNAAFLYNHPYEDIKKNVDRGDIVWTKRRKLAKAPGFLIQYGGGAASMAKQTGLDRSACDMFIRNYYSRYKEVKRWQDNQLDQVIHNRTPSKKRGEISKAPIGRSVINSITGRTYTYYEQERITHFGIVSKSFSPTQVKNYPVQGFATGDIVPMMVGKLWTQMPSGLMDDCLMINTVHDSIIFDCKLEKKEAACNYIRWVLKNTPDTLAEEFGIDTDLPFNIDIGVGKTWYEAKS